MFIVTVKIQVKPEDLEVFMPLMRENAERSYSDEPGCHRFDICQSRDDPGTIFLYEVYSDEAAFQAHTRTVHYAAFSEAANPLMLSKEGTAYDGVLIG
ncbi:MAG: putative quinol monooxygenase [Pseudomonadota bacterium]